MPTDSELYCHGLMEVPAYGGGPCPNGNCQPGGMPGPGYGMPGSGYGCRCPPKSCRRRRLPFRAQCRPCRRQREPDADYAARRAAAATGPAGEPDLRRLAAALADHVADAPAAHNSLGQKSSKAASGVQQVGYQGQRDPDCDATGPGSKAVTRTPREHCRIRLAAAQSGWKDEG